MQKTKIKNAVNTIILLILHGKIPVFEKAKPTSLSFKRYHKPCGDTFVSLDVSLITLFPAGGLV